MKSLPMRVAVGNPKRRRIESLPSTWYPYYPGFSESFAETLLSSAGLERDSLVLDPWNGSGTTTSRAGILGLRSVGFDLNPVMVIVAKARCLDSMQYSSLVPLTREICRKADRKIELNSGDALLTWLRPESVGAMRGIEAAIQKLLVNGRAYASIRDRGTDDISGIASFFYVGLFRTLRKILRPFMTSNPTWIKRPATCRNRLRPRPEDVRQAFQLEVTKMLPVSKHPPRDGRVADRIITVASSECLPLRETSVDFVLASPPYCTRIDYAVATAPELAIMGYSSNADFNELRRSLIGNTTVSKTRPIAPRGLGETCLDFLRALASHTSKASGTYYYKNHIQYFLSIAKSLSEISRVLKPGGHCVLVVQDSYYKNLRNNLPQMFIEMSEEYGLKLFDRRDFRLRRTMAGINPATSCYRDSFSAVESVLLLSRDAKLATH